MASAVERLFDEFNAAAETLEVQGQVSLALAVEDAAIKIMIIAGASECEQGVMGAVKSFFEIKTKNDSAAVSFVEQKALERQYHTLFDWKQSNTTRFFSFFGDEVKERVTALRKSDATFQALEAAFMEVGSERNVIAHDYGAYSNNKTIEEAMAMIRAAHTFVALIPSLLY